MSQYDEELVSQFTDVTGVDNDQARFYLESSAWQLEVALVSFYENEERQHNASTGDDDEIQEITASDAPARPKQEIKEMVIKPPTSRGGITNTNFATLSSLNKDSTSSDEEEGQAFYAGGSENSGQQVLGPGKKKNNIVTEMFKSAQEHGAEVVDPHQPALSKKKNTFTGVGYRLGQTNNDSEGLGDSISVPDSLAILINQAIKKSIRVNRGAEANLGCFLKKVVGTPGGSSDKKEVNVTLKMWHEGFSINEGPLRRYSDPETREFLSIVGRGEIPDELLKEAQGNEVHLNMEDHSHEEYVPVKPKLKVFSGKGNVLGSPTPNTVVDTTSTTSAEDRTNNEDKAKAMLTINPSEPTTTVQIRLADGSRLAATLNHSHTVRDIREFIKKARPEYSNKQFNLMTTFPNKELEDDKTLADAGILNSAIMQRLT